MSTSVIFVAINIAETGNFLKQKLQLWNRSTSKKK